MKLALIGYMGSGKSTLGQELALNLGLDFYELDAEIEKKTGYTIAETIFNKGELYFRKLERECLEKILEKDDFVLSTGGGTPCYYDNIDLLNKNSISIYLQYSVNVLYERLHGNTDSRPLIAHLEGEALQEYIGKHLFERSPFYEKAIFTIRGAGMKKEDIIQRIKDYVNE